MQKVIRLKPKFVLKKTLKPVTIPEPTNDDLKAIEEMEAKLIEGRKKLAQATGQEEKKKLHSPPEKPPKKKVPRREVEKLGDHIPMKVWVPMVTTIFKGPNVTEGIEVDVSQDAYRVDVTTTGWRLVVMACFGGEFTVTLYYDYGQGFNTRQFSVDYIPLKDLQSAINWVMESKSLFETKKEGN